MDIYSFSLALGATGLAVMGLSGLAHALAGAAHAHVHAGGLRAAASRTIWSLLSPRSLFGVLLGFGATGMALHGVTQGWVLSALAAAGGLVLELGVMSPLSNFLFQFESAP